MRARMTNDVVRGARAEAPGDLVVRPGAAEVEVEADPGRAEGDRGDVDVGRREEAPGVVGRDVDEFGLDGLDLDDRVDVLDAGGRFLDDDALVLVGRERARVLRRRAIALDRGEDFLLLVGDRKAHPVEPLEVPVHPRQARRGTGASRRRTRPTIRPRAVPRSETRTPRWREPPRRRRAAPPSRAGARRARRRGRARRARRADPIGRPSAAAACPPPRARGRRWPSRRGSRAAGRRPRRSRAARRRDRGNRGVAGSCGLMAGSDPDLEGVRRRGEVACIDACKHKPRASGFSSPAPVPLVPFRHALARVDRGRRRARDRVRLRPRKRAVGVAIPPRSCPRPNVAIATSSRRRTSRRRSTTPSSTTSGHRGRRPSVRAPSRCRARSAVARRSPATG